MISLKQKIKTDARRDDIVREFQKLKRKFNIDNFGLSVR